MLLTISTTHRPATDLGFLLMKHPDRTHERDLPFGKAHLFFPEAGEERCTAALLLDIDPVGLVRGGATGGLFDHYVTDRPFAVSSFLSVAQSRLLGTAMGGRSRARQDLAGTPIPLEATLAPLPVRGGVSALERLFAPLGYKVEATRHPLDPTHPEWGDSIYVTARLAGRLRLAELLTHLFVLVPVLDDRKHYFVGEDEIEKLLAKGAGWLESHPERDFIARRYLKHRASLTRAALTRLDETVAPESGEDHAARASTEEAIEAPIRLNDLRLEAVVDVLRSSGATSVVDLGCGEGKLLKRLLGERHFTRILGVDVAPRVLDYAARRLRLDEMPPKQRARIGLMQGALTYRDARLTGFEAAAAVEVIEHLDPDRLPAFEQAVFGAAAPGTVVVTTPNREVNVLFDNLCAGGLRHPDHRFEWTRSEFHGWAKGVGERHGYKVEIAGIGEVHPEYGPPTQMAIFRRTAS